MGLLDGQRAIVTGGGSGIGAATCRLFASEGARVGVLDRRREPATTVAEEVGGVDLVADVADGAALTEAVNEGARQLGGLTVLVNNAGVGNLKSLHTYTDAEWALLIGVNLSGTFHGIRAAVPHLRAVGGGVIVNNASVTGVRPTRGEGPYSAAKAGVIALTRGAALEYGPDIRVNCVSPGFIDTPLTEAAVADDGLRRRLEGRTPLGRVGTAEEVAEVITFLASPKASYVTGQNLLVDGGSVLPSHQSDELLRSLLANDG